MSEVRGNPTISGSLTEVLKRVMLAAAVVCLLALSVQCLIRHPAETVLAEAEVTQPPTFRAMPVPVMVSPTSPPNATPKAISTVPSPVPSTTSSSPAYPLVHVVNEGETLAGIARAHGVSLDEVVLHNQLSDPDLLYVGQRLTVPRATSIPQTPEPSPTPMPIDSALIPSLSTPDEMIDGRWIDVDISEQRLTAYEASEPVRTTLVSTGLPNTPTPVGQFRIWIKLRFDDMAGADYYIEDVPYVMYFHEGYGLHGVTWHGNFGHPMSHGCVNLPTPEAEWLFDWADVGTLVNVHD